MGMNSGKGAAEFSGALWAAFLSYLYSQGKIDVPQDFRTRISAIRYVLDSDTTGVINTLLDYSINTASQTDYTIECADDTLKALLNEWLRYINLEINGVPTGIVELSKEYYKERWKEGSLILARAAKWKIITIEGTSIRVPTVIWLVNSASIFVERDKDRYTLGTDKFFLDQAMHEELPAKGEKIVIQRPFDRWWTQYATPYIVRKGIYRNYKALEMLQEKTEEVLTKFIPYLFAITKGTERQYIDAKVDFDDNDLKALQEGMKEKLEQYKRQRGKTPVWAKSFDVQGEHLIPDLRNMLSMELFNQGYRAILAGLGFVDVIQGLTATRKEAVLNPAPFIEEVNAGVDGFKSLLTEIIYLIIQENQIDHRRLFNRNKKFYIANTPLKVNVQPILTDLRQGFIYGSLSVKTYQEVLGVDPETERERMKDEWENGDRELFYPHIIQNVEEKGIDTEIGKPAITKKAPVTQKEIEKDLEKNGQPNPELTTKIKAEWLQSEDYYRYRVENSKKFQKDSFKTILLGKDKGIKAIVGKIKGATSMTVQTLLFDKEKFNEQEAKKWVEQHYGKEQGTLTDNIEDAPYHKISELPDAVKKLPEKKQRQWMHVWNSVYDRTKNEARAYRSAWSTVHKTKGEEDLK
jgi:cation transport regulator ChaB